MNAAKAKSALGAIPPMVWIVAGAAVVAAFVLRGAGKFLGSQLGGEDVKKNEELVARVGPPPAWAKNGLNVGHIDALRRSKQPLLSGNIWEVEWSVHNGTDMARTLGSVAQLVSLGGFDDYSDSPNQRDTFRPRETKSYKAEIRATYTSLGEHYAKLFVDGTEVHRTPTL